MSGAEGGAAQADRLGHVVLRDNEGDEIARAIGQCVPILKSAHRREKRGGWAHGIAIDS